MAGMETVYLSLSVFGGAPLNRRGGEIVRRARQRSPDERGFPRRSSDALRVRRSAAACCARTASIEAAAHDDHAMRCEPERLPLLVMFQPPSPGEFLSRRLMLSRSRFWCDGPPTPSRAALRCMRWK